MQTQSVIKNDWVVVVSVSEWYDEIFQNWLIWYNRLNLNMETIVIAEDTVTYDKYNNFTDFVTMHFDMERVGILCFSLSHYHIFFSPNPTNLVIFYVWKLNLENRFIEVRIWKVRNWYLHDSCIKFRSFLIIRWNNLKKIPKLFQGFDHSVGVGPSQAQLGSARYTCKKKSQKARLGLGSVTSWLANWQFGSLLYEILGSARKKLGSLAR